MASQNKYCLLKQHEKNDKDDFFLSIGNTHNNKNKYRTINVSEVMHYLQI